MFVTVAWLFLVVCLGGVVVSFGLWILIWLCLRYIWCLVAGLCWFDCLWFVVFGVYCLVL